MLSRQKQSKPAGLKAAENRPLYRPAASPQSERQENASFGLCRVDATLTFVKIKAVNPLLSLALDQSGGCVGPVMITSDICFSGGLCWIQQPTTSDPAL